LEMKFDNLKQFTEASMINRAKWLREAFTKDVATVMEHDEDFRFAVFKSVGKQGIISLAKSKTGNYEEALARLLSIEFKPHKQQPADLIQLYKDFILFTVNVLKILYDDSIKSFLVDFEGYPFGELNKAVPLNYEIFNKKIEEYTEELKWYIENHNKRTIHHELSIQELILYIDRSSYILRIIEMDEVITKRKSDPFSDDFMSDFKREQSLQAKINDIIALYKELFRITREELENNSAINQTDWIDYFKSKNELNKFL
jgi:hypothetical protein